MAGAPEFSCPHSPDPNKPKCIPYERCFLVERIRDKALTAYALTRRQAQDNEYPGGGPFVTLSRWGRHIRKAKQDATDQNCGQPNFFNDEIDHLTQEKKDNNQIA